MTLTKAEGTDTHCWTADEVAAIVNFSRADSSLHWLADVVVALASTGLRISELASLRWSDVDTSSNVIHLTDETSRSPRKAAGPRRQTKSSRSRSFPISREMREVLDGKESSKDGLIFHGPRGGVLRPDTVRTVLVRGVLTPLASPFPSPPGGTGFKDGRLHSFRHSFCSTCANNGVPELAGMHWLGHRPSEMLEHDYHLHDAEAQRQMQRVQFITRPGDTVSSDS